MGVVVITKRVDGRVATAEENKKNGKKWDKAHQSDPCSVCWICKSTASILLWTSASWLAKRQKGLIINESTPLSPEYSITFVYVCAVLLYEAIWPGSVAP